MNTKITAGIAAGFLAVGLLAGAAGATIARDGADNDFAAHMNTAGMVDHMAANGMGSMMSMMGSGPGSMMDSGSGSMVNGGSMMGGTALPSTAPSSSPFDPTDHAAHHSPSSPRVTK